MRVILLSRCSTAHLSGFAFRLCCGSSGSKKIQVMRMAWIFLLDCSYWFACIGSLVLFRQQHGAVLSIIDDVHFCCDRLFRLRNVRHFKLRLFRGMVHDLQTVLLAEPKHLSAGAYCSLHPKETFASTAESPHPRLVSGICLLIFQTYSLLLYLGIKHLVQFPTPHGNGFRQLYHTKTHIQYDVKIIGSHVNRFHKLLNECAELFGISFQFPPLRIQVCHIFIGDRFQQLYSSFVFSFSSRSARWSKSSLKMPFSIALVMLARLSCTSLYCCKTSV